MLSFVGLNPPPPPPLVDELKLVVEQDMEDISNLRSGEDPLEDPIELEIDMAPNPLSSDLREKGLVGSNNVSIPLSILVLKKQKKQLSIRTSNNYRLNCLLIQAQTTILLRLSPRRLEKAILLHKIYILSTIKTCSWQTSIISQI